MPAVLRTGAKNNSIGEEHKFPEGARLEERRISKILFQLPGGDSQFEKY